jgi:hypothetical protein
MRSSKLLPLIALVSLASAPAFAQDSTIVFDTELTSLTLTGGPFPMPLASDPGNALGDSQSGYGFVNSLVTITLSSQRGVSPGPPSLGEACAIPGGPDPAGGRCVPQQAPPFIVNPPDLDGRTFQVNSFFDVFYDITVTDVDPRPGRDYPSQPNGASLTFLDNGPANMQDNYSAVFQQNVPNYNLIPPPEVSPYIGHFAIEIPIGGDINGNGENDKIKFQLAVHEAADTNRTFVTLPNGTVIDQFDSAAFLQGAVVDLSTDPPFEIGAQEGDGSPDPDAFGGPCTARSRMRNDAPIPTLPTTWGRIKAKHE